MKIYIEKLLSKKNSEYCVLRAERGKSIINLSYDKIAMLSLADVIPSYLDDMAVNEKLILIDNLKEVK